MRIVAPAGVLVLGWLGRTSFTPRVIDALFGISDYVAKQVRRGEEAGYSASFVFRRGEAERPALVMFHAFRGDSVVATINGEYRGSPLSPPGSFRVLIDNIPWHDVWVAPDSSIVHGQITDKLRFDIHPGGEIHLLRVVPVNLDSDGVLIVECLVLVRETH